MQVTRVQAKFITDSFNSFLCRAQVTLDGDKHVLTFKDVKVNGSNSTVKFDFDPAGTPLQLDKQIELDAKPLAGIQTRGLGCGWKDFYLSDALKEFASKTIKEHFCQPDSIELINIRTTLLDARTENTVNLTADDKLIFTVSKSTIAYSVVMQLRFNKWEYRRTTLPFEEAKELKNLLVPVNLSGWCDITVTQELRNFVQCLVKQSFRLPEHPVERAIAAFGLVLTTTAQQQKLALEAATATVAALEAALAINPRGAEYLGEILPEAQLTAILTLFQEGGYQIQQTTLTTSVQWKVCNPLI